MTGRNTRFLIFSCILTILTFSLFSNAISPDNLNIALNSFYFYESEYSPGKFSKSDKIPENFTQYNGSKVPLSNSAHRRMITFITEFTVDEKLKDTELSLYLSPANYAERLYLNNTLIQKIGKDEKDYDFNLNECTSIYLSKDLLYYGNKKNLLVIELYPVATEEKLFHNIVLSAYAKTASWVFLRNLISVHIIQAACILSFFVGVYLMFLFFTHKFEDKKLLWFGLVCFFFPFAYSNIALNFPLQNIFVLNKISRITFPWTVISLTFFIFSFTSILHKNKIIKGILGCIGLIFNILVLLQPTSIKVEELFNIIMLFFLGPQLLFSSIILSISIIKNRKRHSLYILGGFIFVITTAAIDIYNATLGLIPYAWTVPYGFFAILICIFFIIALEQAKTYTDSINHATSLDKKNLSLEQLIRDITNVSKNIYTSNIKLDQSIQIAGNVTEEYRKSNTEIIEKIRVQFDFITTIISNMSKRINIATTKIPEAIANQTSMVKQVKETISGINNHIISTMTCMVDLNKVAQDLFKRADESSRVIVDTKKAIDKISEYSSFLQNVLTSLEDISEKTSILSINASIEAARSGAYGKGFSVIAGEIRNLSSKSKKNLNNSFHQIKDMETLILNSSHLSSEVSKSLSTIIEESHHSAKMANQVTDLIKNQKQQSAEILQSVNSLLNDTLSIKSMTDEEKQENIKIKTGIEDFQNTLYSITKLLIQQEEKQSGFSKALTDIKTIMAENQEHMEILNKSVHALE